MNNNPRITVKVKKNNLQQTSVHRETIRFQIFLHVPQPQYSSNTVLEESIHVYWGHTGLKHHDEGTSEAAGNCSTFDVFLNQSELHLLWFDYLNDCSIVSFIFLGRAGRFEKLGLL